MRIGIIYINTLYAAHSTIFYHDGDKDYDNIKMCMKNTIKEYICNVQHGERDICEALGVGKTATCQRLMSPGRRWHDIVIFLYIAIVYPLQ